MIYLLPAIGLILGGSITVHIYTQTVQRTTQIKQNNTNNNYFGRVRAMPRLCEFHPGICLTTEEKARKNLSQYTYYQNIHTFQGLHTYTYTNTHTHTHTHTQTRPHPHPPHTHTHPLTHTHTHTHTHTYIYIYLWCLVLLL